MSGFIMTGSPYSLQTLLGKTVTGTSWTHCRPWMFDVVEADPSVLLNDVGVRSISKERQGCKKNEGN